MNTRTFDQAQAAYDSMEDPRYIDVDEELDDSDELVDEFREELLKIRSKVIAEGLFNRQDKNPIHLMDEIIVLYDKHFNLLGD